MDSDNDFTSATGAMMESMKCIVGEFNERCSNMSILFDTFLSETLNYGGIEEAILHEKNHEQSKHKSIESRINRNTEYLKKREVELERIKAEKTNKEEELSELERQVKKQRENIASRLELKERIKAKKDEILTYKLLTRTSFDYSGKKVTGLVSNERLKYFKLDPEKLSQDEITQALWQLIIDDEDNTKK
ncbi:uncharacterized protein LOC115877752 [Sitophilus oryzae]|uniref:Uncharacterized protein LOC115877752 n=1 Tax=Sitophilus oryzae TaxID=7048 RepID=A0A6J2XF63_SITOR|nr:uncharacterized protein LOC115877752 [Sitophilus oryzae]XP_030749917.1 uncharacterized protein LOC115877752 [Sitophilus oryzae]